jgi:class III poly(R)-hydroxyalkanoic acid synthase PhaE subunit
MARHEIPQAWMDGWKDLQQQFLHAWQGSGAASAPHIPLHEGFELWARLAGGGESGNETVDRMVGAARQFVGMMQAAIEQASGTKAAAQPDWSAALAQAFGKIDPVDNPVADALRGIAGKGAHGFEQMFADLRAGAAPWRAEFDALTHLPAFGYSREAQVRQQQLAAGFADYAAQMDRYNGLMLTASRKALERLESKLIEHSEPGRQFKSFRELYDAWIDAAEEGYAEVALSDEFRHAYGALVNAQMQVRKRIQQEVERSTGGVGMPTRTEVDAVHRKLAAMQRRIAELEHRLAQAGPVEAEAAQPVAAPAAAASRRRVAKVKPPRQRAAAAEASAPTRRAPVAKPAPRSAGTSPLAAQLAELKNAGGKRKGGR